MEDGDTKMCAFSPRIPIKKGIIGPMIVLYMVAQRRDPNMLATQYQTDCNNGKLFISALGKSACTELSNTSHFLLCD